MIQRMKEWIRDLVEELDAAEADCEPDHDTPDGRAPGPWTLPEALVTVRALERRVRPLGYFTGLTGGVLYRGSSKKDLDVILCPLNASAEVDHGPAYDAMRSLGWVRTADADRVRRVWRAAGSTDTKHVEVWLTADRRRVDVMFLR